MYIEEQFQSFFFPQLRTNAKGSRSECSTNPENIKEGSRSKRGQCLVERLSEALIVTKD